MNDGAHGLQVPLKESFLKRKVNMMDLTSSKIKTSTNYIYE